MKLMSFALTTAQIILQTKTVTRRFGWWNLKTAELVQPVIKCMGLKKGEKVVRIGCPILIVSTRKERLWDMTDAECVLEGFPYFTAQQFVDMLCEHYNCGADRVCNRIEFEYTEELI